jgi:Xaa-Pro dipeptidase
VNGPSTPGRLSKRWERYAAALASSDADAFVLTSQAAVRHATDIGLYTQKLIPQRPVAAVLAAGVPPAVVCVQFEEAQITSEHPWATTIPYREWGDDPWKHVARALQERDASRVLVEETIPAEWFSALQAAAPTAALRISQEATAAARIVKDADELATIERSSVAMERALARGAATVTPGRTENDIALEIASALVDELGVGIEELAASCIAPENNRKMHHRSSETIIPQSGLMRLGALVRVEGYWTLITRMLALHGDEPEAQQYAVFVNRYLETMRTLTAGAPTRDLYAAHRKAVVADGFEMTTLKIAHGTGLDFRELPWVSPVDSHTLEPGTVLAYDYDQITPDGFVMHVEDRVLITPSGPPRRLSNLWRLADIRSGFEPALETDGDGNA